VVKEPPVRVAGRAPESKERISWEAPPERAPTYQPEKAPSYLPEKASNYAAIERAPEPRVASPIANSEQVRAKVTSYIGRARDFRVRGDYSAALSELNAARAADPASAEVRSEIEQTRRACLAEKRLGRSGLDCG
jgi:hypothetical protein